MANDWILDVLADLTDFAHKSGLPALERQLRVSANVANLEIASIQGMVCVEACAGVADVGVTDRPAAAGRNL